MTQNVILKDLLFDIFKAVVREPRAKSKRKALQGPLLSN